MKEVNGFYGSQHTPCTVYYYEGWYCVEGSLNVNRTHDEVEDGVDVEELEDYDFFTASYPIYTLDELFNEVNN